MKKNTKGIFIDSENRVIEERTVSDLEDVYKLLKIQICDAVQIDKDADIIIDDEGLLKSNYFFQFNKAQLAGNGLVVGLTRDGDWNDSPYTVDEIKKHVRFLGYLDESDIHIPAPVITPISNFEEFFKSLQNKPKPPQWIGKQN